MTTIQIDNKDRDALAAVCITHGITYYLLENLKGDLLTVVVYCDSPGVMFHLGRCVQNQVEINLLKVE